MSRSLALAGLVVGLAALILQFAITIPASMDAGRSLALSIVYYFSFFTILTNISLVLIYASELFSWPALGLFRRPIARATAAAAITLVMGFYHFLLAGLWQPQGLFWVCDMSLHYITPILYLVWFAFTQRSGSLAFSQIPLMLLAPLIYLVYVMLRGLVVGEYPYPVLEAHKIGYPAVAQNALGILILLALFSALAIAIDRFRPNTSP